MRHRTAVMLTRGQFGYLRGVFLIASLSLCLSGCQLESQTMVDDEGARESEFDWRLPASIPLPVEPEDNPMTEAKFQLGRHLFYDARLSVNGEISCASCHHQSKAFSDGIQRPVGATGEVHPRNSQSLTNSAYFNNLTWGNPALATIEQQIMLPLFGDNPIEHGIDESNFEQIIMTVQADETYQRLFLNAFPEQDDPLLGDLAWNNVVKAIGSFVRGMTSFNSAFDRGDLSASARRGEALFNSERLECFHCHDGYNFSDATIDRGVAFLEPKFHNTGLYNIDGMGAYPEPNTGRHEVTGNPDHMGQFRTPSLRNVAVTAPYNHDGSVATLEEVIRNYARGGRVIASGENAGDGRISPFKDGVLVPFRISDAEVDDLVAFLESLTDHDFLTDPRFSNPWESTGENL